MSELFFSLFENDEIHIERIESRGASSELYDQDHDEWVYLLEGNGKMILNNETLILNKNDSLFIKAHQKHQVLETSLDCVWLAVHIKKEALQ